MNSDCNVIYSIIRVFMKHYYFESIGLQTEYITFSLKTITNIHEFHDTEFKVFLFLFKKKHKRLDIDCLILSTRQLIFWND